jgi:hypothetical protein
VQEGHAFDDEDGGPDGVAVADVDQRVERLVADSGVEFRELSGDELVQVLLVLRLVKVLVVVKDKVEMRGLAKLGSMLQSVFSSPLMFREHKLECLTPGSLKSLV